MTTETDLNKPKYYLIIKYNGSIDVIKSAKSFKNALLATEPNGLLKKSLEAFDGRYRG